MAAITGGASGTGLASAKATLTAGTQMVNTAPSCSAGCLFDRYLMVDWSAAARPSRGHDSIWYCLLQRTQRGLRRQALENPPTRHAALVALLAILNQPQRRVLVGFDFPNGYPAGFAARLDWAGLPWRAVWDGLAAMIQDAPDNANNRFTVAAELNRRLSGGPYPFWGCPPGAAGLYLQPRKSPPPSHPLPERRLCERWLPRTSPCWKLYTVGSVGSQALLGIPIQRQLRQQLGNHATVWPFETGLSKPHPEQQIVIAEVYPSLVAVKPRPGEIKDALQVEAIAHYMAARDANGQLAADLAGPPTLDEAERQRVVREEGWILGVGTATSGKPPRRCPPSAR